MRAEAGEEVEVAQGEEVMEKEEEEEEEDQETD